MTIENIRIEEKTCTNENMRERQAKFEHQSPTRLHAIDTLMIDSKKQAHKSWKHWHIHNICIHQERTKKVRALNVRIRNEAYASDISPLCYSFFYHIHDGQQKQLSSVTIKAQVVFHFAEVLLSLIQKHHVWQQQGISSTSTRKKKHIVSRPEHENIRQKRNRKGENTKMKLWEIKNTRKHVLMWSFFQWKWVLAS